MQRDIVQRLDALIERQRDARGDTLYKGSADPELVDARAEITRLTEALRLQMEAKHKEAAEAKLWFQKAQEWKEALRAAEEREMVLLSALEEWMFRYFWRVDGMPVEAARIHAQSRMKIAALAGAKP